MRCFIAVDVEDAQLLDAIAEAQRKLQSTGADLKLVERENLHITLRFLGEISPSLAEAVGELIRESSFKPFRVGFRGVGAFPNTHRPRVIWIGVSEGAEELKRLHARIEKGLLSLGFRGEDRSFTPHLTIARVRSGRNRDRLAMALESLLDIEFGSLTVSHVRLKRSTLTPRGPIYTTLAESAPYEA
ncbi:MAG TPA: RNA 2',3'-cyclic phosphodiesterase [Candidatus Bathyarchaeota archaeon]|nr:RNA 2',3'-cyclic phosphodiesterase [Candidatus Bathyarchaeota archaeon]